MVISTYQKNPIKIKKKTTRHILVVNFLGVVGGNVPSTPVTINKKREKIMSHVAIATHANHPRDFNKDYVSIM